ncbi:hypothetical protein GCM10010404_82140 [Nonomuraea africana]|uniref:DUF1080 domain-containing protein n=1 Tax=Nonomuraea africana TaxID=46171 RepID=A0ABR9KWY7_9ACTN|nr:hypothetical protein [Nonomuraea africana]MBE1566551.1 hypothetical protein [Nonomuraea africana]
MGRHLSVPRLPVLASPPEPPAAGEVALFPAPDGTLRQLTAAGQEGRFSAAFRKTLANDFVHGQPGTWAALPGLAVPVQPGLHRLNLLTETISTRGLITDLGFTGPAAVFATTEVVTLQDGTPGSRTLYGDLWDATVHDWTTATESIGGLDTMFLALEPGTVALWVGKGTFRRETTFENDDTLYWQINGADLDTASTDFAHAGERSGKLAALSEERAVLFDWNGTEPGISWRLEAWLYSPTGHPRAGVSLSWYDAQGNRIDGVSDLHPLPAGSWTHYSIEAVAPADTIELYAHIGMEVADGHAAGGVVYVDDCVWSSTGGTVRVNTGAYLQVTPI